MKFINLKSVLHKAFIIAICVPFLAVSQNNNNGQGNQNATNKLHPIGNVGIGTANPNSDVNLEVIGNTRMIGELETRDNVNLKLFEDPLEEVERILTINRDGKIGILRLEELLENKFKTPDGGMVSICTTVGGGEHLRTGSAAKLSALGRWASNPGVVFVCPGIKVGIGTETPKESLHINNGNALISGGKLGIGSLNMNITSPLTVAGVIESTQGGYKFPDGTIQNTASSNNFQTLFVTDYIKVGTNSLYIGGNGPGQNIGGLNNNIYSTNGALSLQNGSTQNTIINPSGGRVGIGTNTPGNGFILDIAGAARACRVEIEINTWCDFVF
jgi:hypothetical protein